jgi:hypothetical protein
MEKLINQTKKSSLSIVANIHQYKKIREARSGDTKVLSHFNTMKKLVKTGMAAAR